MPEHTQPTADASMPERLDSPTAKLVYTYLRANGPSSPEELAADLDMQRLTLYPVLETLTERDHLRALERGYTTAV